MDRSNRKILRAFWATAAVFLISVSPDATAASSAKAKKAQAPTALAAPAPEPTEDLPLFLRQHPLAQERLFQLRSGETLPALLQRAGVGRDEAGDLLQAMGNKIDPRRLMAGQEIRLVFQRVPDMKQEKLLLFAIRTDPTRELVALRDLEGRYAVHQLVDETRREIVRAVGRIDDSLYLAATRAGVPPNILAEAIRVFSYDVDFQRDIHPGDGFEFFFEREADEEGATVRAGNLLFAALTLSGKTLRLYRHIVGGRAEFFDDKGRNVRKALLRTPIDGAKLTSRFGMRQHPILGYSTMHRGIDFGAPTGTPIMAAGDGVMERVGPYEAYGNYILIRHTKTHATAYAHMSRFAGGARAGKRVRQGEVIGYVGSTGRSTGPHLHYEILVSGKQVNPINAKSPPPDPLAGRALALFLEDRNRLDAKVAAAPAATRLARR
ncbi:MAG: M23 family metallopeptidase [Alphaproteobacteria bacterium]|nr:M23 family metallopeptidase [Alphaproteobacteria bacterium]